MLRRYMGLITDQGLDAAIPLVDNPEDFRNAGRKFEEEFWQEASELYHNYAPQIFDAVFEKEKRVVVGKEGFISYDGYLNQREGINLGIGNLRDKMQNKMAEYGKSRRTVDPGDYQMFMLRAQIVNPDIKAIFAVDEEDFELLRSGMSGLHAAFYILDGMIRGETELGRFGETAKKEIIVLNKMEDPDIKKLKKLRREFYDDLNRSGEEDPDEI